MSKNKNPKRDVMLYAIIQYCTSKDLTNNTNDVLASLAVTSEIGDTHMGEII